MSQARRPRAALPYRRTILHPGGCSNARLVNFASRTCARTQDARLRLRLLALCANRTLLSTDEIAVLLGVECGPERLHEAVHAMLAA